MFCRNRLADTRKLQVNAWPWGRTAWGAVIGRHQKANNESRRTERGETFRDPTGEKLSQGKSKLSTGERRGEKKGEVAPGKGNGSNQRVGGPQRSHRYDGCRGTKSATPGLYHLLPGGPQGKKKDFNRGEASHRTETGSRRRCTKTY